jgi:hypothetical protein
MHSPAGATAPRLGGTTHFSLARRPLSRVARRNWGHGSATRWSSTRSAIRRVTRVTQEDECTVSFATKIWAKTKEFDDLAVLDPAPPRAGLEPGHFDQRLESV